MNCVGSIVCVWHLSSKIQEKKRFLKWVCVQHSAFAGLCFSFKQPFLFLLKYCIFKNTVFSFPEQNNEYLFYLPTTLGFINVM